MELVLVMEEEVMEVDMVEEEVMEVAMVEVMEVEVMAVELQLLSRGPHVPVTHGQLIFTFKLFYFYKLYLQCL